MTKLTQFFQRVDKQVAFVLAPLLLALSGFFWLPTDVHRVTLYAFLIGSAFFLLKKDVFKQFYEANKVLFGLFCAYLALNAISVFWNPQMDISLVAKAFRNVMLIFLFVVAASYSFLNIKNAVAASTKIYVLTAAISVFLILGWHLFNGTLMLEEIGKGFRLETRYARTYNSNVYAKMLLVAVVFAIFSRATWQGFSDKIRKVIKPFIVAVLICGLVFTGGRGALLASLACLVVTPFFNLGQKRLIWAAALTICTIAMVFVIEPDIFANLVSRADTHRLGFWETSLDLIRQKPIFGYGFDSQFNFVIESGLKFRSVHNLLLGTTLYTGVIGALILLSMAAYSFVLSLKYTRRTGDSLPLALLIAGAFLFLTTGHTLFLNLNPEWLFSWLPIAYIFYTEIKRKMETSPSDAV